MAKVSEDVKAVLDEIDTELAPLYEQKQELIAELKIIDAQIEKLAQRQIKITHSLQAIADHEKDKENE
jgi:hypothetical protein